MEWGDEPWVKLYRRDTADWLLLSWKARGLFYSLLRVVNRAGVLELGKTGKRAVAVLLGAGAEWKEIVDALEELVADGCVQVNGASLVIPNFVEAQEAVKSDKARAAASRARRRDAALAASAANLPDDNVTKRDASITNSDATVTTGHAASRGVTRRHEETRSDQKDEISGEGVTRAPAREEPTPSSHGPATTATGRSLLDAFRDATGSRATLVGNMAEERGLADMLARLAPTAAEVMAMGVALGEVAAWWPQGKRPAPKHVTLRDLAGFRGKDGSPEWGPLSALVAHVRAKSRPVDRKAALAAAMLSADPWVAAAARAGHLLHEEEA